MFLDILIIPTFFFNIFQEAFYGFQKIIPFSLRHSPDQNEELRECGDLDIVSSP